MEQWLQHQLTRTWSGLAFERHMSDLLTLAKAMLGPRTVLAGVAVLLYKLANRQELPSG